MPTRIYKRTKYHIEKIRRGLSNYDQTGDKNPHWKGDGLGRQGIHDRMRIILDEPSKCEHCDKEKKLDLSNKSGEYKLVKSDWQWLCRSCHLIYDRKVPPRGWKVSEEGKKNISQAITKWWVNRRPIEKFL